MPHKAHNQPNLFFQYYQPAQNQPKSHFLFPKNVYTMTLDESNENILMQLGKSTMESTCANLFYAHGALTDEGVSGAAMCSGGGVCGAAQLRFRVDPESFPCVIRGGILQ